MIDFKPMLACNAPVEEQLAAIKYPCLVSPKLDGIRATKLPGRKLLARSLKNIPNSYVQERFADPMYDYLDGELVVGTPTAPDVFRSTTSAVMSHNKPNNALLYVFDHILHPNSVYQLRRDFIVPLPNVVVLEQRLIQDEEELLVYEEEMLLLGYEGLIVRAPHGRYKYGRSTLNEGIMFKVKRFQDDEATIVGFVERMRNENEQTVNELGRSKRSGHAAGLVGRGDLGAFIVEFGGHTFQIGTGIGLDDYWRKYIWENQSKFIGQPLTFKSLRIGVKDAPRHPVAKWTRDRRDM